MYRDINFDIDDSIKALDIIDDYLFMLETMIETTPDPKLKKWIKKKIQEIDDFKDSVHQKVWHCDKL